MDIPQSLWIVLDSEGRPEFAAGWREAAHEHIKDAIEIEVDETASQWVVREYVPADELTRLRAEVEALRADSERLTGERDVAIGMLAYWCVAVDQNGTGWDDWDEHYKDAMYRPCPIRELLDKEINAVRAAQGGRG